MNEEDKRVSVIETYTMFGVDVVVHVKVKKTTCSDSTRYKCAEIVGLDIPADGLDWSTKDSIIKRIQQEALDKVKKHEEEIMQEKEE